MPIGGTDGYIDSWEKKRKDKEAKYFQEAQALLTKCVCKILHWLYAPSDGRE